MARYHIVPSTGNPGICSAKKKCPFGDIESAHYSSKELAREAYENNQKLAEQYDKFSNEIFRIKAQLNENLLIPRDLSETGLRMSFRRWIENHVRDSVENAIGEAPDEDEYLEINRDTLLSIETVDIDSKTFWKNYLTGFTQDLLKRRSSQREKVFYPENFVVSSPFEKLGDRETAKKLLGILKNYPSDDLENLLENNEDFTLDLEESGFVYVGSGYEQFVVSSSDGTIWKAQKYNLPDSPTKNYVFNQLIGQEFFPKNSGLRHANTTGYVFGDFGVIAQEEVFEEGETRKLSRKEALTLELFGHTDLDDNYVQMNGEIVAFDSSGESYGDMDYFKLSGVKSI